MSERILRKISTGLEREGGRVFLLREAPPFAASLVLAETLYKFHSFSLEFLAFAATWLLLSRLQSLVFRPGGESSTSGPAAATPDSLVDCVDREV